MPSQSLQRLSTRLKDVEQLLAAHTAIIQLRKAANARQAKADPVDVLKALVNQPGRGKPKEVDAINRAAYVLTTAHFQGFVEDLHAELGTMLLNGKAADVPGVLKLVFPKGKNPHVDVINQAFSGIGVYELMNKIAWQKCSNESVKKRLKAYLETRNKIAHGTPLPITKKQVSDLKSFVELLADRLDTESAKAAQPLLGKAPW